MDESTTEEGIAAQVNIFKDFNDLRPIEPGPEFTPTENQLREYMVQYSARAYTELTDVVGLDASKIEPIKSGGRVTLDPVERQKMVDYLISTTGVGNIINKAQNANLYDPKSLMLRQLVSRSLSAMDYGLDITIAGPLVTLEFESTLAMALFNAELSGGAASGVFIPMPIGIKGVKGHRERIVSDKTFLNFVNKEAQQDNVQDIAQHERWHMTDHFRQLVYMLEMRDDPRQRLNFLEKENPEKFYERLRRYLYSPQELRQQLKMLKERIPELYDFYIGLPLDEKVLARGLKDAQGELSAFIAGYLKNDSSIVLSDQDRDDMAEFVLRYLPFGKGDLDSLLGITKLDEETNRYVVNQQLIDNSLNSVMVLLGDPSPQWLAIIEKYSKPDPNSYWGERKIVDRNKYVTDMQTLIDFYFNEGGYGNDKIKSINQNLRNSVDGFRSLAKLRGDSYRALFELSLIPISHWNAYVRKEEVKAKKDSISQIPS